jgi:plastocyanin
VQQLSVTIGRTGGKLQFTPQTLNAFTGDQVFWINNDTVAHQPAALNPDQSTTPIVDSIPPGETSNVFSPSPLFNPAGNPISYTIQYTCVKDLAAHGAIAIVPNP